jgi:hypothetical protein
MRESSTRTWIHAAILGLALALAGGGCIESARMDSAIEAREQLAVEVREGSYAVPVEAPPFDRRIDPIEVPLTESMSAGRLERVGVRLGLEYDNETGSAAAHAALFAAGERDQTYAGAPLLDVQAALEPGSLCQVERTVEASPRLLDLVRGGRLFIGLAMGWQPAGGTAVGGRYRVTMLQVLVTSQIGGVAASFDQPRSRPLP